MSSAGAISSDTDRTGPASEPELYLYDNFSGGIGQSEPLYCMHADLLQRSQELLAACPCAAGCPSCVGPLGEVGEKAKEVAAQFLNHLLTQDSGQAAPAWRKAPALPGRESSRSRSGDSPIASVQPQ